METRPHYRPGWLPWAVAMVFVLVLLFGLLGWAAAGDAHEWFTGTKSPDGRVCCNNVDCKPVPSRFNVETAEVEVQIRGKWWPAFDPSWYLGPSPDGSYAGCQMPSDKLPRCVWGGAGS